MKYYESGFELWRGKSALTNEPIVAILTLKSQNEKTGDMAQLWILRTDMSPLEAIKSSHDSAICGECSLRHSVGGQCYVRVGESPLIVYKAWKKDAYTKLKTEYYHNLKGLRVRMAAYGDPTAIPVKVLQELVKHTGNYTGYTHQWKNPAFGNLKSLCMASVENPAGYHEANAMGWRTFRILAPGDGLLPGEIMCVNNTHGVQCTKCQLCRGSSRPAKNIAIPVHGPLKSKFRTMNITIKRELNPTHEKTV